MDWYLAVVQKYAVFEGRARRTEYWMFLLFNIIISIVLSLIEWTLGLPGILSTLYSLAILIPSFGVSVRRLHDTDRSGWWLLIGFIPILGWIVLLVLMALEGHPGENQYGQNPKELTI